MQYRNLGKHDLKISSLSLGTVALGMAYGITPKDNDDGMAPPTLAESTRLIHRALEAGINHIDTARGYGNSEEVVGHALKGKREQAIITTKVSCFGADGTILKGKALLKAVDESIETSLRLLQTDHVDVLMLHSAPTDLLTDGEALSALRAVQARGLTRLVGASTYGSEAPLLAIDQGAEVLQVAFNILDQQLADKVLPLAAEKGVGMVIRSVFLKGALTSRAEDLPPHLSILREKSTTIAQYVTSLTPSISREEAALRFVTSHPQISTALVGVRTIEELKIAVVAANKPNLSDSIMARLGDFRWDNPLLNPGNWGS